MKILKSLLKFLGILFLLVLLLLVVACAYVHFCKEDSITRMERYYNDRHDGGRIQLEDYQIYLLRDFPIITTQVQGYTYQYENPENGKITHLQIGDLETVISLRYLIFGQPKVKSFSISNAVFRVTTDSLSTTSTPNEPSAAPTSVPIINPEWLVNGSADVHLKNVEFDFFYRQKKKRFSGTVHDLKAGLLLKTDTLEVGIELDVTMDRMAFNLEKGTFFNGARCVGNFNPYFDIRNNQLTVDSFDLKIDDQTFGVTADLHTVTGGEFEITLTNPQTVYSPSFDLVNQDIQKVLTPYQLNHPFYTYTSISGALASGQDVLVKMKFHTEANQAQILGDDFNQLSFKGHLANRLYASDEAIGNDSKGFRIVFSKADGWYKGAKFKIADSEYRDLPDADSEVTLHLISNGKASQLDDIMRNNTFFFRRGNFVLLADLNGPVKIPEDVFDLADIRLTIDEGNVYHRDFKLLVPFHAIDFGMEEGHAVLHQFKFPLLTDDVVSITGEISNFTALLFNQPDRSINSNLDIYSKDLSYADFMAIYSQVDTKDEDAEAEDNIRSLKDALRTIYDNFNPHINLTIDQFSYRDFMARKFKTGIFFTGRNQVELLPTHFDFNGGQFDLTAAFDISDTKGTQANFDFAAYGRVDEFNKLLATDQYRFADGDFKLYSKFSGKLADPVQLLEQADTRLLLKRSSLYAKDLNATFLLDTIDVRIVNGKAFLKKFQFGIEDSEVIRIDGSVHNFTTPFFTNRTAPVRSGLNIESQKINTADFLKFVEQKKAEFPPLEQMVDDLKQSLRSLQKNFNPRLTLNIDTLIHEHFTFQSLETNIYFKNKSLFTISDDYVKMGEVDMDFRADIQLDDEKQMPARIRLNAGGNATQLNNIFQTETFIFKEGDFLLDLNFEGDLANIDSIANNLNSSLAIDDAKVFWAGLNYIVPMDSVRLVVNNGDAVLHSFQLPLTSGHRIDASGELNNFNSVLFDSIPNHVNSALNVHSKYLNYNDFTRIFKVVTYSEDTITTDLPNALKETIKGIYMKFNPRVNVQLDQFLYKSFQADDLKTTLFFKNKDLLYLEKAGFKFGDAPVSLDAEVDVSHPDLTSFATNFKTDQLNIKNTLKAFDYFGLPSLRDAESVDGHISLDVDLAGSVADTSGQLQNDLNGSVEFDLRELSLLKFQPIEAAAGKFFRKKRLENIHFAPMANRFVIRDGMINIPRTEIQSTAFHFFVEGKLDYGNNSSLWMSIPLGNLWFRDYSVLPQKKGFNRAGMKFFVQAKGNEENTLDYKFRLTNKKLYLERGKKEIYRADKKRERRERRKARREKRRERRKLRNVKSN